MTDEACPVELYLRDTPWPHDVKRCPWCVLQPLVGRVVAVGPTRRGQGRCRAQVYRVVFRPTHAKGRIQLDMGSPLDVAISAIRIPAAVGLLAGMPQGRDRKGRPVVLRELGQIADAVRL